MERTAHAKLNITLEIKGSRPDGYHELDMIFLEIEEGDLIILEKDTDGITLTCSDPSLPTGEKNLAYKAAKAFFAGFGIEEGVRIHIEKKIPAQAGLGGGSSDAACVINGLNELFEANASVKELEELAAQLGSDVPFFIKGGCQRAKGRGEILSDIGCFPPCFILVAKPDVSVSTPRAYQAYDETIRGADDPDADPSRADAQNIKTGSFCLTDAAQRAIGSGDLGSLCAAMTNDLEEPVIRKYPKIRRLRDLIRSLGAEGAMMTGSGSAVFGLFSDKETAARALAAIGREENVEAFLTCSTV